MNRRFIYLLLAISIKVSAQEYRIELENHKFQFEYSGITIDSVVDVRNEKKYIGFVLKGTTVKPAYLVQPLNSYLDSIIKLYTLPGTNPEHLILRINKLVVTERSGGYSQYLTTEMNISFIKKQEERYFEKYRCIAYIEKKSDFYTRSMYSRDIIEAFEWCIGQYVNKKSYNEITDNELVETKLKTNQLKTNNYPIRTITNYTPGIYNTFNDFLNYRIDSTLKFNVVYANKQNNSGKAILKDKNNMEMNHIWGFCNGKQNYCKIGNSFYPLQKEDSLFSIVHFPVQKDILIPIVPAFGLLGGIVLALAAEVMQSDETGIRTESKIKYFLNYNTGRFYPFNQLPELKFESNVVLFSSQFNKAGNDLEIDVNGKKCTTLSKNTYCKLGFTSEMKEAEITIKYNGEKYTYISHPLLFNTELLLIVIRGNKIVVDKVNSFMKSELMRDIDKGKIKKTENIGL